LNKNIVLYIKCYVKQCCTEPSKPKAIRLYTHLNHLLFQVITFELEPPQVIQSIKRLVFSKTKLREVLPSSGLGLGPDEVGQKGQNYSTYDVTHKNSRTQNQKSFFSMWIRRIAKSFEGLNSFLAQSAEELWTCKNMWKLLC